MNACKENYSKVVRTIMSHPDFDQIVKRKDENGETGFMKTCIVGHLPIVKLLLMIYPLHQLKPKTKTKN